MTTSSYMPNVVVEICFTAGYGSPTRVTWVDVSDYVDNDAGISISVGRGDERSEADANQLTLTLDNRDGRFTPDRVTSPYYPNVKLDRPIRVTATPVDGSASVRFLGFINEWPVEWEGSDGYARVTISASSRLARLGVATTFTSVIEEAVLLDSPSAYYTLGEPADSAQANDSSGNAAPPLMVVGDPLWPLTFGQATGPGTDGLTAVSFAPNPSLSGQCLTSVSGPFTTSSANWSVELFALATFAGTGFALQLSSSTSDHYVAVGLQVGKMLVQGKSSTGNWSGNSGALAGFADGHTHHFAVVCSSGTATLYADGVSVATVAGLSSTNALNTLTVGSLVIPSIITNFFAGTTAHVATYQTALTAGQVAAHAAAGLNGFTAETTSARLLRYAAYARVPLADVSTETGQTTVQHVDTTGKQPVELMRLMETTEGGVLFDDRGGSLTFHNRAHRLTAASAFTLDMTQHMVEAGYSPKLDRSALLNDITGSDVSGGITARVFDSTSRDDYGIATGTVETASDDDNEPLFLASWLLYKYKTPKSRVAELSVDALAQVGKTPNCATVMAANVGTKITVAGHPQQAAYSSTDYFVEGYSEVYGPESLRFTFNVSPSSPDDMVLVVDDTARGVVDTNPVAL